MKKMILFLCTLCFLQINVLLNAQEAVGIDQGISDSVGYFSEIIKPGTKIVVLNIQSESAKLSEYIIDELIKYFLEKRTYTIVDRQNLDLIQQEMDFQLSGEVSDESALSIGKKLGAEMIIFGAIDSFGSNYRLRLRAIDVETAAIHGIQTKTILTDNTMAVLLGQPAVANSPAKSTARQSEVKPAPVFQQKDSWLSMGGGMKGGPIYRTMEVEYEKGDYSFEQKGFNIGGGMFLDLLYALVSLDFLYEQLSGSYGFWTDSNTAGADTNTGKDDDKPESAYFFKESDWWNGWGILNIGLYGKYPFRFSKITLFPLAGMEYGLTLISGLDSSKYNALWLRFGGGIDFSVNPSTFIRFQGSYGFKFNSEYEKTSADLLARGYGAGLNNILLGDYSYTTQGFSVGFALGSRL